MDEEFYMGLPTSKGFMDRDKCLTYDKHVSVFKFQTDPKNRDTAYYEPVVGDQTFDVLKRNYNNSYLKEVCRFVVPFTQDSISFKITKKGCAKYSNGRWIILYLTEIEFETEELIEPNRPETVPEPKSNEQERIEAPNMPVQSPSIKPTEFFMGMPDGNYFPGYAKSFSYKPGISMFKFRELRNNEAKFQMISDTETLKFIKNSVIDGLKPACVMSNLPSLNTIEIETIKTGIVSFNGTDWKIEKQSEIRFK